MTHRNKIKNQALCSACRVDTACCFETLEGRTLLSTATLASPSALTAAATSTTSVQLNWKDNTSSATGYNVLRSSNGKTYNTIATIKSASANSYTDTTGVSGTTYDYEVESFNATTTSNASNYAAATTKMSPVTNVTATATAPTTVALAWTDNDASATGYNILRATDLVHFTQIAKLTSGTASSYTDRSAVTGVQNQYEVVAFDAATSAPASAQATVAMPMNPPSSLTASATRPTTIVLNWKDNSTSATGYNILRASDGVHFVPIAKLTSGAATTYTDSSALADSTYQYEVIAFNATSQSAPSASTAAVTPPTAPASLTATAAGPTTVNLTWTDKDPNATGYVVLRSTDNKTYTTIATLTSASANSYSDSSGKSFTGYFYEVKATVGSVASAASNNANAMTLLFAPSSLKVTATASNSVSLSWTENDPNAAGYLILRSTNGSTFTQIAKTTGAGVVTYTDSTAASATSYTYEVQAYNGTIVSTVSNAVAATTLLPAPTALTATATITSVQLNWTATGTNLTGFNVLRSTDGVNFTTLASVTGTATTKYVDTAVTFGATYYYEVQSVAGSVTSSVSAKVSATVQAQSGGVTITTRFGDELDVTEGGKADSVKVDQSGSNLTILADGTTFSEPAPADGLFIFTRGGTDSITVDPSVTDDTTVEAIDGAVTTIAANGVDMNVWCDSNDIVTGTATLIHRVANFAGNVSKATGASLADPSDSGAVFKTNLSLFGAGPVAGDINQGEVGDCYFLASLAAFATSSPQVLTNSAVDMGDGTYVVQFMSGTNPTFVRVNSDMPAGPFNGYMYAHPGANNTNWAAVMEKAFCYYRAKTNTYASINSGWMQEVYGDFGVNSNNINMAAQTESAFYTLLSTELADGDAVTFGTFNGAPNLVNDHAYTLVSVYQDSTGTHYVVRNPWGFQGDAIENAQGYATLTYAQMIANFDGGTYAVG